MALNFEKFAKEGNEFINKLANRLGHPEERGRTSIVLRAVLHSLRERITISESLNMLSQLPMSLKAVYVDNWKYREKPLDLNTRKEFIDEVEKHQEQYGEQEFSWKMSTEEIIQTVFSVLVDNYISKGEFEDIIAQLPKELKELFRGSL
ncbi:MAG: DUF2267 domain-containing protein [Bacteroidales bacterium]